MSAGAMAPAVEAVPVGGHAFWAVSGERSYLRGVERLTSLAQRRQEKAVLFGPQASIQPAGFGHAPAAWLDPAEEFLRGGPLDPGAMFSAFEEQVERAKGEGFAGLMVVADMDWLLPAKPSTDDMVSFELLLDRGIHEFGNTVICAYRSASFGPEVMAGVPCVHPIDVAGDVPYFQLVSAGAAGWSLSGEADIAAAGYLEAAVRAAAGDGGCDIDVSNLEFIDVCGMRAIVGAASGHSVRLVKPRQVVRRSWEVSGFAAEVPWIRLVD